MTIILLCNSEKAFRIYLGSCNWEKFILTYLSWLRKSLKTELQPLLPLNFANTKIFVLFLGGTNFIQKFISISKNWPRWMKLSEIHQDICELGWKKICWWNFIPSCSEFCEHVLFSLIFSRHIWMLATPWPNALGACSRRSKRNFSGLPRRVLFPVD